MPDDPRKSLEYNLIWMERTFKERSVTESLLAPERENGLLNHHDYELALAFLPGIHRHYNVRPVNFEFHPIPRFSSCPLDHWYSGGSSRILRCKAPQMADW